MKNFFLTLVAFPFFSILTACGALVGTFEDPYDKSCDLGVGDSLNTWEEIEYLLPECWEVTSSDSELLILEGLETTMKISKLPFEGEEANSPYSIELSGLEPLYLFVSPLGDPDVERILKSIAPHPLSIASSNCDAPDSTYAYSTQQTWKTLSYDLVFCWGAEEVITAEGQTILFLKKGDGSAWVQITLMSGVPEAERPTPVVTQNEDETTTYVYESYFTVVTNAPDDNDVQSILYSLNRANLIDNPPAL